MPINQGLGFVRTLSLANVLLLLVEARPRCLQRHQILIELGNRGVDLPRIGCCLISRAESNSKAALIRAAFVCRHL